MRRIDLSCAILAPIAVGLIMTYVSNVAGIIFICAWNITSFFAEYYLLLRVYRAVPRLAVKQSLSDDTKASKGSTESIHSKDESSRIIDEDDAIAEDTTSGSCSKHLLKRIETFWIGWRIYFRQTVALAGTSLALIYLTVLGFSSVTTGYAYTQRLSGAILSGCFAMGSLMGIIGTFLFPRIRKRCGLVRTGIVAFGIQWSMLILCVVSIWSPGSPSDLYNKHNHLWQHQKSSILVPKNSSLEHSSSVVPSLNPIHWMIKKKPETKPTNRSVHMLNSVFSTVSTNKSNKRMPPKSKEKFSYFSVSLLMAGLILSRIGLWMTDLTVTQLMQENVIEKERGIVSGTQSAFNAILDMMHYILTIILPSPNQFGVLTLVSFSAISLGFVSYICFYFMKAPDLLRRERGIGSVSSFEWNKDRKLLQEDPESKGLTGLEDEEEEIIRGTLTVRPGAYNSKQVL